MEIDNTEFVEPSRRKKDETTDLQLYGNIFDSMKDSNSRVRNIIR